MGSVEYYQDAGAGIVTLAESGTGNRLQYTFLNALREALRRGIDDSNARIMILRSNGPVFSLGLDFSAYTKGGKKNDLRKSIVEAVQLYREILFTLFTCKKPVLAVVQGEVKAGGVGLVCASDIVTASDSATVELSEVIFGLIPANVLPYLLQTRVPLSKARYLILTAKKCSAEEARSYGIFDDVFPPDRLEKGVRRICKQLMRSSPNALARTKAFTLQLSETPFLKRPELAESELVRILNDESIRAEISRFQEGELPGWFASFSPESPLCVNNKE